MTFPSLQVRQLQFNTCFIVILSLLLTGCGGSSWNPTQSSTASAPFIQGFVFDFPVGSGETPANLPTALVSVIDSDTGGNITDATVTVNGVVLTYNSTSSHQEYEGTISINPGDAVNLIVRVQGKTYSVSGTAPTTYPAISAPIGGATWATSSANTVSWSGGAPLTDSLYLIGVLDASDPAGGTPYFHAVATDTNTFDIPAYTLASGSRDVIVGLTKMLNISGAFTNSALIIGGFGYVPVTLTGTPIVPNATLTSISIIPSNPAIENGATVQLAARGVYSDNSIRDLSSQVVWSNTDNTKATISSLGLVSTLANGSTTVTATLGSLSGSTSATIFTPLIQPADWRTFQGDAAHSGYVNVTLDPALFTQIWTWSRPAGDTEPIGGINSVATAAGKVIVTKDIYFGQGVVYALNEADGTLNWAYDFGPMASEGPPAISNGNVFVPTNDQSSNCVMWALDITLGTYKYKMPSTCQWSAFFAPTIYSGSVLQATQAGALNNFSIATGGLQWSGPAGTYDQTTPAADSLNAYQYGVSGLKVFSRVNGDVVATISDPFVTSFSGYSMFSAPMLGANGNTIVYSGGGFSGRAASSSEQYDSRPLVSYDIAGSTIAWRTANTYLTHPAIANGVIYVARNAPATLDAISEVDGHIIWSWTPPVGSTSFHRNTVVTNNLVFVSTDTSVFAIDLNTHQSVWQYAQPGMLAISASPNLYIATGATISDGNLVAIKLK